jgi:ribosome biogenesis GTPase
MALSALQTTKQLNALEESVEAAQNLDPMLMVESVNALAKHSVAKLASWCGEGKTVLFLGSSGIGKSTLVNTLMGDLMQATSGIREDSGNYVVVLTPDS